MVVSRLSKPCGQSKVLGSPYVRLQKLLDEGHLWKQQVVQRLACTSWQRCRSTPEAWRVQQPTSAVNCSSRQAWVTDIVRIPIVGEADDAGQVDEGEVAGGALDLHHHLLSRVTKGAKRGTTF